MSEDAEAIAETLSDDAIMLGFAWSKMTVNSHPPHANITANAAPISELMSAGLITREHEVRRDIFRFRGTPLLNAAVQTPRVRKILLAILSKDGPA